MKSIFVIVCLFSLLKLSLEQLFTVDSASWVPKDVYTFFKGPENGAEVSYTVTKNETKFGFGFLATGMDAVLGSDQTIFEANSPMISMSIRTTTNPSVLVYQFDILSYSVQCEVDYIDEVGLDTTNEVYIYTSVNIDDLMVFGYLQDEHNKFVQTTTNGCLNIEFNTPYEQETVKVFENEDLEASISDLLSIRNFAFYPDFQIESFLGLMADFNSQGAKLKRHYFTSPIISNKLLDVSKTKDHMGIDANYYTESGIKIKRNQFLIPNITGSFGNSFAISFWLYLIPDTYVEHYNILTMQNEDKETIYKLSVKDNKFFVAFDSNEYERSAPLEQWIQITIHSHGLTSGNVYFNTIVFYKTNATQTFNRAYRQMSYTTQSALTDNTYQFSFGEQQAEGTTLKHHFIIDDIEVIEGGTIHTITDQTSKIEQYENCMIRAGFNELNTQFKSSSANLCLLCAEGYLNLKNKCVVESRCSVIDAEKRVCKDVSFEDIDGEIDLVIEYVKGLKDGHQIKITVPDSITFTEFTEFKFTIDGLEYGVDFFAQPVQIDDNTYLVDITFKESINSDIDVQVSITEKNVEVVQQNTVLPPVEFYSDEEVEAIDTGLTAAVGVIAGIGAAAALPLAMTGNMSILFGLLDIMQIITLMVYINARYPLHVEMFFDKTSVSMIPWFPNWANELIEKISGLLSAETSEIVNQDSYERFLVKEVSSSFLLNGGQTVTLQVLLLMLAGFFTMMRKMTQKSPRASLIFRKAERIMDINFFARSFQGTILPLALAVNLQFQNFDTSTVINCLSLALCIIGFFFVAGMMTAIFKVSRREKTCYKAKDRLSLGRQYQGIFEHMNMLSKFGCYYMWTYHFKKILITYILVFTQAVPIFQIVSLTILYIVHFYCIVKYNPIGNSVLRKVFVITEVFLFFAHICASFYIFEYTQDVDVRYIVGWVLIGLLLATIMINIMGMLVEVCSQIKEVMVQLRRMVLRMKQAMKRRTSVKIRRVSRHSVRQILKQRKNLEESLQEFRELSLGAAGIQSRVEKLKSNPFLKHDNSQILGLKSGGEDFGTRFTIAGGNVFDQSQSSEEEKRPSGQQFFRMRTSKIKRNLTRTTKLTTKFQEMTRFQTMKSAESFDAPLGLIGESEERRQQQVEIPMPQAEEKRTGDEGVEGEMPTIKKMPSNEGENKPYIKESSGGQAPIQVIIESQDSGSEKLRAELQSSKNSDEDLSQSSLESELNPTQARIRQRKRTLQTIKEITNNPNKEFYDDF